MLWNRSLVMMDQETGGLWSHLLGRCMRGPLKGTELKPINSVLTTWTDWKTTHPGTDVMLWPQGGQYQFDSAYYRKVGLNRFVAGITIGGRARAYPFDALDEQPIVNDSAGKRTWVVAFDPQTGSIRRYDRRLDDQILEFQQDDQGVVDTQTGSHWDMRRGVAIEGALKGKFLTSQVIIPSFRAAWETFYPDSEYWKAE